LVLEREGHVDNSKTGTNLQTIGRLALPEIKIAEDSVASGKLVQLDFPQDANERFHSRITDIFTLAGAPDMPSVRELFDLARQYYVKSNDALNPDVREALRSKGDDYMQKADELRRVEIIRGVFPGDRKLD
jgi:hypothetical protein